MSALGCCSRGLTGVICLPGSLRLWDASREECHLSCGKPQETEPGDERGRSLLMNEVGHY